MTVSSLAITVSDRGVELLSGTHDVDEVFDLAARSLRPHRLKVKPGQRMRASMHGLIIGSANLSRMSFEAPVTLTPVGSNTEQYRVVLPVAGRAEYTYGRDSVVLKPGFPTVLGPHRASTYDLGPGFDNVTLRLPRSRVEAAATALWPTAPVDTVEFAMGVHERFDAVLRLTEAIAEMSMLPDSPGRARLIRQMEGLIAETLLLSHMNTASAGAAADAADAASRQVRDAMDYMLDHIAEPITMAHAAAAAGVSLRSMQAGFAKITGTTPTRWLRHQRLERAYARLRDSEPQNVTVASIAMESGLFHLGDFSTHFKAQYGRSPSQVLGKR